MASPLIETAPAKVNLALHVLGRYANGWHELESLVFFAGYGDTLTLVADASLSLSMDGPGAADAGPHDDNLVLRAARRLLASAPGLRAGAFRLTKRIPVAAGLGGGSADAAATLRLLARANGLAPTDERLFAAACETGADVPVCLDPRARMMAGIGEKLGLALSTPALFAVLANPRVAVETKAVFAAMGLAPGERSARAPGLAIEGADSAPALIARLRACGNDMEDAARALAPAIGETLDALRGAPGARLVRMSGSGATCFALFDSRFEASRAAAGLRVEHPDWWVKATVLR